VRPPIPILDLQPEIEALWDELNAAFQRVLRSGQFIGGPEVEAFESEVAAYLGVEHAVGVNSGTDALVIGLRALGVGPGDEVITTPFSFFATAESISAVGATPVFADADERSFNLDLATVEPLITERTRAILPVHLYGRPAEMTALLALAEQYGLRVVEDCAQSCGARYEGRQTGTLGDVGAFSFFPSKNLGGFGDGGLLATDNCAVAEQARMLRAHGGRRKYHNELVGYNSRLDAIQAALLRVKLPHVDAWNAARHEAARRYEALLAGVGGLVLPEVPEGHVFHQYTVRVLDGRRDAVAEALAAGGVGTMVYYPVPQHALPVYAGLGARCPVAERLAGEVLSLPMGPHLTEGVQERIAEAVRVALSPASPAAGRPSVGRTSREGNVPLAADGDGRPGA
jgi:dTDP-4-amino-4,6-dideoxygalactose transaminase